MWSHCPAKRPARNLHTSTVHCVFFAVDPTDAKRDPGAPPQGHTDAPPIPREGYTVTTRLQQLESQIAAVRGSINSINSRIAHVEETAEKAVAHLDTLAGRPMMPVEFILARAVGVKAEADADVDALDRAAEPLWETWEALQEARHRYLHLIAT